MECKDLKTMESPFWFTCFTCMFTYMAIINSISVGCKTLRINYRFSEQEAGLLFQVPYLIGALFSPIASKFVEKKGHHHRSSIEMTVDAVQENLG